MHIKILTETLTDGSQVHDVILKSQEGNVIRLPAYDRQSAEALATEIAELVMRHSTDTAEIAL